MESNNPVTVLLADGHPIVMSGVSMSLTNYGIRVIGEATTPEEAVDMYAELSPDVLILNIRFGEKMTGIDAAKEILRNTPDARIVFLSQFDQDFLIKESYRMGARAFITTDCDPAKLAEAVTRAAKGELYFLPEIANRLANLSVRADNSPRELLTVRELEIFILMAKGHTNVEMAEIMDLSAKTISNTSLAIKGKLGIQRSADMTLLAVKHGLIEP